jgi:hypothetical protein
VRNGFTEVVLLVSREVQWLLTTAGWLARLGQVRERLGALAHERTQNIVLNLT